MATVVGLLASACGGNGPEEAAESPPAAPTTEAPATTTTPPAPACEPGGPTIEVSAKDFEFDTDCLAVAADTPFTVTFANKEAVAPHTFSLYGIDNTPIRRGPNIEAGGSEVADFDGLPAGAYYFLCDLHPSMTGDFFVV